MQQARPQWLKKRAADQKSFFEMEKLLKSLSLNTVCGEADCPNIGECFQKKTATFMILGKQCTRKCHFCAVEKGLPELPDPHEPLHVAQAVEKLKLRHVVITSVTRDDLPDGGARHFADTITQIRKVNPGVTVEVLIPDFNGNEQALETVVQAKPEILNHNLETVPGLYGRVRPIAVYGRSLGVLEKAKANRPELITKTGLMLGLGETKEEVLQVMADLLKIRCDILTLGQYLRPSPQHLEVAAYISPEEFDEYKRIALEKGFRFVESGPFVRSSYRAVDALDGMA